MARLLLQLMTNDQMLNQHQLLHGTWDLHAPWCGQLPRMRSIAVRLLQGKRSNWSFKKSGAALAAPAVPPPTALICVSPKLIRAVSEPQCE